ncbi:hypothetical protein C9374_009244 [Naegleria lovaniensis]|uniref:Uncharacterized protein n=1 Tax=Naegleria lovaniensis TaxID=51637 RepID=A0AA88GJN5_NAELO|nr:uncharacterized protein C9374_009244 [Naegleria lovaniensis]KAG2377333.1 hypothetical protein C9374_009244 [Naegleria lovaniensis]
MDGDHTPPSLLTNLIPDITDEISDFKERMQKQRYTFKLKSHEGVCLWEGPRNLKTLLHEITVHCSNGVDPSMVALQVPEGVEIRIGVQKSWAMKREFNNNQQTKRKQAPKKSSSEERAVKKTKRQTQSCSSSSSAGTDHDHSSCESFPSTTAEAIASSSQPKTVQGSNLPLNPSPIIYLAYPFIWTSHVMSLPTVLLCNDIPNQFNAQGGNCGSLHQQGTETCLQSPPVDHQQQQMLTAQDEHFFDNALVETPTFTNGGETRSVEIRDERAAMDNNCPPMDEQECNDLLEELEEFSF